MPFAFDNTYFRELTGLYVSQRPEAFPRPELLLLNTALAQELTLDEGTLRAHAAGWFGGTSPVPGADPLSQAYSGHQFGSYNPQLGDGRAVLLGELLDRHGRRRDVQLKGSGRTPFSRGGDGRATLGPVLREHLMGEAMHALGVPTTRALAVLTTGEEVMREASLPGALLVRVASSHLRVGTLQIFSARGEHEKLRRLVAYALARHAPHRVGEANPALALLQHTLAAQAQLIAQWMLIGFVHGVMNTDNCTLSGETIDYGPCAFMGDHHPDTLFSSIDHGGRYAYGQQPHIGAWNLTRMAEALLPLLHPDPSQAVALAEEALSAYAPQFSARWLTGMGHKLGFAFGAPEDEQLIRDLIALLTAEQLDHTRFFRGLSHATRATPPGLFARPEPLTPWLTRWRERLAQEAKPPEEIREGMDRVNPLYIPRNHHLEEALERAVQGSMGAYLRLLEAVRHPFTEEPGLEDLARPKEGVVAPFVTYCGT